MEETEGCPLDRNLEEVLRYQLGSRQKRSPEVYIDNEPATLDEALSRCVQERSVYMPDYVLDEEGFLEQVRFDKVEQQ